MPRYGQTQRSQQQHPSRKVGRVVERAKIDKVLDVVAGRGLKSGSIIEPGGFGEILVGQHPGVDPPHQQTIGQSEQDRHAGLPPLQPGPGAAQQQHGQQHGRQQEEFIVHDQSGGRQRDAQQQPWCGPCRTSLCDPPKCQHRPAYQQQQRPLILGHSRQGQDIAIDPHEHGCPQPDRLGKEAAAERQHQQHGADAGQRERQPRIELINRTESTIDDHGHDDLTRPFGMAGRSIHDTPQGITRAHQNGGFIMEELTCAQGRQPEEHKQHQQNASLHPQHAWRGP